LQSTIEDESHFSTPDCLFTLSKDVDTNPGDDLVVVDPSSASYSAFDSEGVMPGSDFQITSVVKSMQNEPSHSLKSSSFNDTLSINPSKVCIVIEPLVATINNQVETLQRKEIDALALGGIAGNLKPSSF